MGFDEQYERMIKRQLGGMLQEYIDYSGKEDSLQSNANSKQAGNMRDTVREFREKFGNGRDEERFRVKGVEDMPQRAVSKEEYQDAVTYNMTIHEMDIAGVGERQDELELEVVGSNNKLYINEQLTPKEKDLFQEEEIILIDSYQPQEPDHSEEESKAS